jgi:signal transduction histidine kinase
MELHVEEFVFAALLSEVVGTVEPLVLANGNRLVMNIPPSVAATAMRTDRGKLRQALWNLLSNACKFTKSGTITLRAALDGRGGIALTVADTGIGITPEQQGRLFQEFVQGDAATTQQYGGTGLGLVISRRFCRLMGGDISLESRPSEGSTFTIRLPVRIGAASPVAAAAMAEAV